MPIFAAKHYPRRLLRKRERRAGGHRGSCLVQRRRRTQSLSTRVRIEMRRSACPAEARLRALRFGGAAFACMSVKLAGLPSRSSRTIAGERRLASLTGLAALRTVLQVWVPRAAGSTAAGSASGSSSPRRRAAGAAPMSARASSPRLTAKVVMGSGVAMGSVRPRPAPGGNR
jgi:hypothetical protein